MPNRKTQGKVVYFDEKRQEPRRSLWLPSHLIDQAGIRRPCLLLNLSRCGAAIRLDDAAAVAQAGSREVVLVVAGHEAMRHPARIVWHEKDRLGLSFVIATDDERDDASA